MSRYKPIRIILYVLTAIPVLLLLACLLLFKSDIPLEKLKEKYTSSSSEFANIMGMEVHYMDEGEGEAIVLIHGTGASLHTWETWAEKLKQEFRVIRMDLPAFGLTGPHPMRDYGIDSYSQFIIALMDHLQIDKCTIAGNSLGGRIAWHVAAKYPERVHRLILIDAAGFPTEEKKLFKMAQKPLTSFFIKKITPKSLVRKNLEQVYFDDRKVDEELVNRYWELACREGNRQAFIDRARTEFKDETALLQKINCPTLILWGQEDEWIPAAHAYQFAQEIPNSKLVIIQDAGHIPMEEVPHRSLAYVLEFLNSEK